MMNDPDVYPKLLEAVKDCVIAPIKMYHILLEPTSAVSAALNSPITSFDHITELAEGATHDNGLVNLSKTFGTPREGVPLAFGKALESNEFTVIRGWDSSLVSNLCVKIIRQLILSFGLDVRRASKQQIESEQSTKWNLRTFEL